jgi:hypothetical protein
MEQDLLATIIDAETEIRERIAGEERRAARMLAELRRELDDEAAREEERLAAEVGRAVAAAGDDARERAAALVHRAAARAERLSNLDQATLERRVLAGLGRIVPEPEP